MLQINKKNYKNHIEKILYNIVIYINLIHIL